MAHESFEDAHIAAEMNDLFVNIKVDRWPLTMFLAPDGTSFWGGTYFPPEPR